MYSLEKFYAYVKFFAISTRVLLLFIAGYSAIEPGEGKDRWLSPNFVRKLADSSARFIATMHQDTADGR